jgi:hypothetical protein
MVTIWRPTQIVLKEYKRCGNGRHVIIAILVDQSEEKRLVVDQERCINKAETKESF